MWWYEVKDVHTGQSVDIISFAIIGTTLDERGRTLFLHEHRHAHGMSIDYMEITPAQVLLHRLVDVNQVRSDPLRDVSFTPPLPVLRAPLDVGREWSESIQGGKSYVYQVEARVTVSTIGRDIQDCLRVVRTRGGTLDFKTEYCPEIGVAAIEILTPNGKWLRAELLRMTTARLALQGLRGAAGGCLYRFDPVGFLPDEPLTLTLTPPGLPSQTQQVPPTQPIVIGLRAEDTRGPWIMSLAGASTKPLYVLPWTGQCRASFLAPPPTHRPSLSLIRQEVDKWGNMHPILVGSGWRAGEALHLTQEGPGWIKHTFQLGHANALGVSDPAIVPFTPNPLEGEYTFTLQGDTQTATLTVLCRDGFCGVK